MTIRIVAIAAAFLAVCAVFYWVYQKGVQSERTASLTKGVELVKERDKLNVQVRNATTADICRSLGGIMSDDGQCN